MKPVVLTIVMICLGICTGDLNNMHGVIGYIFSTEANPEVRSKARSIPHADFL